jgi:hypothetical protein
MEYVAKVLAIALSPLVAFLRWLAGEPPQRHQ